MFPSPTDNPFEAFSVWLEEAIADERVKEPTAMCVASADESGAPSARMVLLKGTDERGFVFYTNFESRKGEQLLANPRAAAVFFWQPLGRQVRVEATVQEVAAQEADGYFNSRPRDSRIGAWASQQSRALAGGQKQLVVEVAKSALKYPVGEIPRPPYWSGFRLVPHRIEFWQEGRFRLHQRLLFTRENASAPWQTEYLYP